MDYPKIDVDSCTGCGICIDACTMEAIELYNGTAKIIEENCSNCRACVDECPMGAIS